MSVAYQLFLTVGIDPEEPGPTGVRLIDRWRRGELGPVEDITDDPAEFDGWAAVQDRGLGVDVLSTGSAQYGGASGVVVGKRVVEMAAGDEGPVSDGVKLDDLRATAQTVTDALRRLGDESEPRILLCWNVS